jgi:hypothetical protein
MSAIHDSIFKMGTLCPGTLRNVFPPRRNGSRFIPSRASPGFRVRITKDCWSLAASTRVPSMLHHLRVPGRTHITNRFQSRQLRPPTYPAVLTRRSAIELRVPPDGLGLRHRHHMNGVGSVDGPKHLPLPPLIHPTLWVLAGRSQRPFRRTMTRVSRRRRKLQQCSLFNRPRALLRLRSQP